MKAKHTVQCYFLYKKWETIKFKLENKQWEK